MRSAVTRTMMQSLKAAIVRDLKDLERREPIVAAALEAFPGAEIVSVRRSPALIASHPGNGEGS